MPSESLDTTAIDPEDRERAMLHLRGSQRLVPGLVAGTVACVVGASVWAAVGVFTRNEIAWIAIGIGWLVGVSVRIAGRGFEVRFAALGAALSLVGVLLGKILLAVGAYCRSENLPFWDVIGTLDPADMKTIIAEGFSPIDLLFYGLAVWMGWKYARRDLEDGEITTTLKTMKSER